MMARPLIRSLATPDIGHVRAAHVAGLRHLAERQDVHERLLAVERRQHGVQIFGRFAAQAPHIDDREYPAIHRHEMRCEGDKNGRYSPESRPLLLCLSFVARDPTRVIGCASQHGDNADLSGGRGDILVSNLTARICPAWRRRT